MRSNPPLSEEPATLFQTCTWRLIKSFSYEVKAAIKEQLLTTDHYATMTGEKPHQRHHVSCDVDLEREHMCTAMLETYQIMVCHQYMGHHIYRSPRSDFVEVGRRGITLSVTVYHEAIHCVTV